MATKRKSAKPRRMSKAAARIHAEAEEFAESFGKIGTVDGAPMNPKLRTEFQKEGLLPGGPVHVVLDNTVPQGFRMEPV